MDAQKFVGSATNETFEHSQLSLGGAIGSSSADHTNGEVAATNLACENPVVDMVCTTFNYFIFVLKLSFL